MTVLLLKGVKESKEEEEARRVVHHRDAQGSAAVCCELSHSYTTCFMVYVAWLDVVLLVSHTRVPFAYDWNKPSSSSSSGRSVLLSLHGYSRKGALALALHSTPSCWPAAGLLLACCTAVMFPSLISHIFVCTTVAYSTADTL